MATIQNTFKISQLSNISELDPHDLFLVSDHRDNKFYTRKLSAATLFKTIKDDVIAHINSSDFIDKLTSILSTALSITITPSLTQTVITNAIPSVINQAIPQVSNEVVPIVSDIITDELVTDLLENEALPAAISNTISSNAANIWDILVDGNADNTAVINAGDADPSDDIVNAGGA